MSTTIDLSGADTYFDPQNHVRAAQWAALDEGLKEGALAQAKRAISRHLRSDVEAETVDADGYYYPDRAVYEQALFAVMQSGAIPNGELTAPHWSATDDDEPDGVKRRDPDELCAEAARWLGRPRRQVYLMRG